MLARQPISLFRAIKIIQAVVADGEVPEHGRNVQWLAILEEFLVSVLIDLDGFLEAVLPKIDIGDIAVQPREPELVFVGMKDAARFFAQAERPFVLPAINQA